VIVLVFLFSFVSARITGDSLIEVSGREQIEFGDKLGVGVTLIPRNGEAEVVVNYLIKDSEGKIYVQESETVMIGGEENFNKRFSTEGLPVGNYIIGMELVYPEGVAASSSRFEIVERGIGLSPSGGLGIVLVGLGIGVVVLIVLIIIFVVSRRKKRKRLLR